MQKRLNVVVVCLPLALSFVQNYFLLPLRLLLYETSKMTDHLTLTAVNSVNYAS